MVGTNDNLIRKYLYIYGGFSFDCTTACYDTWAYEITYGPQAYYPPSASGSGQGNYWTQLTDSAATGPGARWRHAQVTYQPSTDTSAAVVK